MPIVDEKWAYINFQEIKSSCISHNGEGEIEKQKKYFKEQNILFACRLEKRAQMHKNQSKTSCNMIMQSYIWSLYIIHEKRSSGVSK